MAVELISVDFLSTSRRRLWKLMAAKPAVFLSGGDRVALPPRLILAHRSPFLKRAMPYHQITFHPPLTQILKET